MSMYKLIPLVSLRICRSEGRNWKINQGQLREDPLHRAHTEDSGKSLLLFEKLLHTVPVNKWRDAADVFNCSVFSIRQAVNKLAEIMNRKDMKLDQKKKGSTADLRKKEKENRKLQLELNQEKEKFNHMAIKYQKELSEMQAVRERLVALWPSMMICGLLFGFNLWPSYHQQLAEESTYRNELQMQLDSKESDIEQLREKLNDLQQRMDNSSVTSLQTDETDSNIAGMFPARHSCCCLYRSQWQLKIK